MTTRCEYDSEAKGSDADADVMCEKDLTIIYLTSLKAGQLGRRRQEARGQPADSGKKLIELQRTAKAVNITYFRLT